MGIVKHFQDHGDLYPQSHCQNGREDVCLMANHDGVCCPWDSCDIDDGLRSIPKPKTTEWESIITPTLREYAWVRVHDNLLELKFAAHDYTITMDAKAIPQLIRILQSLEPK